MIKKVYYYILKADADKGHKHYTFYKIGKADQKNRPENLCKKYTKSINGLIATMSCIHFDTLPTDGIKYLTDKRIHKAINSDVLEKVDSIFIKGLFEETDGYDEFFKLVNTKIDVIDYIKQVVATLALDSSNFTAKLQHAGCDLVYGKQKHLVDNVLVRKIRNFADLRLARESDKNILLIGQFLPSWIATFAADNNIIIWHDTADEKYLYDYEEINQHITYAESLEDLLEMKIKFDYIIANPPYGKVGANITKAIIDEVDFDRYINLLPANDYKRNDDKDLFRYTRNMVPVNNGFEDAAVTTHLCEIIKQADTKITVDEFERSNYTDRQLDKYFEENDNRKSNVIVYYKPAIELFKKLHTANTFYFDKRACANRHVPYTKECHGYKWNVLNSIDTNYVLLNSAASEQALGRAGDFIIISFNTDIEKQNFSNLIYSAKGFKFISKVLTAINADSYVSPEKYMPKVDWTRSWTVEEILANYGYTEDEIKEVIEDLKNFKGMES